MSQTTEQKRIARNAIQQRYLARKAGKDVPKLIGRYSPGAYLVKRFTCEVCSIEFKKRDRPPEDPKHGKRNFCSRACYSAGRRSENNPNFKGKRPCPMCGIHVMGAQRVYCGGECQKRHAEKRARERAPQEAVNKKMKEFIRDFIRPPQGSSRKRAPVCGYGISEFRTHIESLFTAGMSWENYGLFWQIDHIRPVSSFKFSSTSDPDFKECWSLTNLQPLTADENMKKGSYYNGNHRHR